MLILYLEYISSEQFRSAPVVGWFYLALMLVTVLPQLALYSLMRCPNCRRWLGRGDPQFCPSCGVQLRFPPD